MKIITHKYTQKNPRLKKRGFFSTLVIRASYMYQVQYTIVALQYNIDAMNHRLFSRISAKILNYFLI